MKNLSLSDAGFEELVGLYSDWPEGQRIVEELLGRCHQSDALTAIDELIEHVQTMGIAPHFRRDRYVGQAWSGDELNPTLDNIDIVHGKGGKLSEAGHKRVALLIELKQIRNAIGHLFVRLGQARFDIEMANTDLGTGQRVPEPDPETRDKEDHWTPPETDG